MRDEILLSRDYFDEIKDKIVNETLNDKDCSSMAKLSISMIMLRFAGAMREELFGAEGIINMLKSTVIDMDYFNQVKDEVIQEMLEKNDLPIEIVLVKAMAMAEFACDMSDRLFGKTEDK